MCWGLGSDVLSEASVATSPTKMRLPRPLGSAQSSPDPDPNQLPTGILLLGPPMTTDLECSRPKNHFTSLLAKPLPLGTTSPRRSGAARTPASPHSSHQIPPHLPHTLPRPSSPAGRPAVPRFPVHSPPSSRGDLPHTRNCSLPKPCCSHSLSVNRPGPYMAFEFCIPCSPHSCQTGWQTPCLLSLVLGPGYPLPLHPSSSWVIPTRPELRGPYPDLLTPRPLTLAMHP